MKNKILDILKSNVTESANDYNKIYEKDFDKLANELLAAISVTRCCEELKALKDGKNGEGMDLVREFNKAFRSL